MPTYHLPSFFKEKYKDKIRLIYTDTDSFVTHIKTDDIYEDFKDISKHISGYDKEHKCYNTVNKEVLGKFKDEVDGQIITHFIGLKPKSYSFKIYQQEKKTRNQKVLLIIK